MTAQAAPAGSSELDQYLIDRIRRPSPDGCHVVPDSTPVVSFGDVRTAWIATLALNPSSSEFLDRRGRHLTGEKKRFETLASLGLDTLEDADDDAVRRVLDACYGYFTGPNPYWRWFRPLEKVLGESVGASFRDGTAVHLDLVQWATDPVWGQIKDKEVRERLIRGDREFLREQLSTEGIRVVLVNGRTATDQLVPLGVDFEQLELPDTDGSAFSIRRGVLGETLIVGWNKPFPNGGLSDARRTLLVDTIRGLAAHLRPRAQTGTTPMSIAKDTTVTSKAALKALLEAWLPTGEKTIGDVSSFGGKPWVRVRFGDVEVVLNADTKRTAVRAYLDHTAAGGVDAAWTVVSNARGTTNKVIYRSDGAAAPGWYAYTTRAQEPGTTI